MVTTMIADRSANAANAALLLRVGMGLGAPA